jgi:hypothetical protein
VGLGCRNDRNFMAGASPLSSKVIGSIFHAVINRAGIVIDQKNVQRETLETGLSIGDFLVALGVCIGLQPIGQPEETNRFGKRIAV